MPRSTCYLDDCDQIHHAQGLCAIHYNRQRKRALRAGKWESVEVDAAPFKERILQFREAGYTFPMLSAVSGIDRDTLSRALLRDRQTVLEDNMDRLYRTPLIPLYLLWKTDIGVDYRVPSYLATRRLRALMSKGYTTTRIEEESGLTRHTIGRLVHQQANDTIMRSNLVRVVEVYERLWDQEPPTPYRHSDLTRYNKWPLPIEWDDDEIDLPNTEGKAIALARNRLRGQRRRGYFKDYQADRRAGLLV